MNYVPPSRNLTRQRIRSLESQVREGLVLGANQVEACSSRSWKIGLSGHPCRNSV
jgi:hypothetical protein